ncbi:TadE family protein [Actinomyces slackii]|uniref:TadE-like protein n=1 Tax=Actinomyces slackii TaxID=52774 RepID=A0A3S4UNF5_9ACTO|nr:TadE family protein [Actinomyces slackii]VEG74578.1 TadE-like protein [Actinomyces slackii]
MLLRSRLRRLREEAGASSVELLVFFPLLMLIVLMTVQVALSWYGNEVARTTAREVARQVRGGDSPAVAQVEGVAYARRVGGGALQDVVVDVTVRGQEVSVEVSGESMDIVAGFAPRVTATVTSQIESFREDR